MTGRRVALAIGCAAASLALAGCSVGVGEKVMKKDDVEKQSAIELSKVVGVPLAKVPPIDCPGDLKAKVGTKMTCILGQPGGKTYETYITVTKVDEATNRVYFDVQVSKTPKTG